MSINGRIVKNLSHSLRTNSNDSCIAYQALGSQTNYGLVYKILVDTSSGIPYILLVAPLELLGDCDQLPSSTYGTNVKHILAVKKFRYVYHYNDVLVY